MRSIKSFNIQRLLRDFDGDHARFSELAHKVLGELPMYMPPIRDAVEAGRWVPVAHWAGYLQSFFSSFLAERARVAAEELLYAAQRMRADEVSAALHTLESETDQFLTDLASSIL